MSRPAPSDAPAPAGLWVGWAAFAVLTLLGFCFGVWAGTQKPERAVAQTPATAPTDATPAKTEPANPDPTPEPKAAPAAKPEPKAVTPKTEPPAESDPELPPAPKKSEPPAKPPEPKKTEPKPEPKKTEPKKPPEPKKAAAPAVTFAKDVQKVFAAHCTSCHGAAGNPKYGLDLRTLEAVKKGGDGGEVVKPGEPDASPLWVSINEGTMPPPNKPKMTEREKKLVKDWIEAGAK